MGSGAVIRTAMSANWELLGKVRFSFKASRTLVRSICVCTGQINSARTMPRENKSVEVSRGFPANCSGLA